MTWTEIGKTGQKYLLLQYLEIRMVESNLCPHAPLPAGKDWAVKKVTIPNSTFLMVKSWEIILSFYLHFTWLYGSWNHQRILKKHPFWKYDSWFSSEVSKLTSVRNKLNLSLKYWFMEAKIIFRSCYGPKISYKDNTDYI